MGTITCPEIREVSLTPEERARTRDSYVRNFDRQFRDWTDIANCCISVERDRDWETLGFHSFHAWLLDAAPASRSYLYLVMGRYKELAADIPQEELAQIPLGSAAVLVQMSKSRRKDPAVRQSAKKKPADFIKDVQETQPDQHIELKHRVTVDFTESQWAVIEATFEKYQLLDPNASLAVFFEWACSEVSEWTLHVEQQEKMRGQDALLPDSRKALGRNPLCQSS
jgi:hypothetical protein